MLEQQDIDQQLYDDALFATIVLVPTENQKNNYVETYAKYCATIALMAHSGFEFRYTFKDTMDKKSYEESYYQSYDEFSAKLFTGGYRIYTTLDLEKQEWLQQTVDEVLLGYTETYNDGVFAFFLDSDINSFCLCGNSWAFNPF
jgi:membrane peptidoglycan carboxypeptidase